MVTSLVLIMFNAMIYGQDQNPTLKETLEWMHNAFPNSQSVTAVQFKQTRELNYTEGKGDEPPSCIITIVDHYKAEDGTPIARDTVIDLSLIDPDSIESYTEDTLVKGTGVVTMVATNDKKIIVEKIENKKDDKPYLTEREFIDFVGTNYSDRFAKAFKNAATICGGKKSAF
jgi:hypothetical protein